MDNITQNQTKIQHSGKSSWSSLHTVAGQLKTSLLMFTLLIVISCTANSNNVANNDSKKNKDMKVQNLTKSEVLKNVFDYENNKEWKFEGDLPCIIDFYADWCGPCKAVAPILDELAKEYEGKIRIYKIDTEKEKELAAAFGIRSIPSMLFVPKDGKPQMSQGALPKQSLIEAIESVLLKEQKQ